jgi:hypothetical protein
MSFNVKYDDRFQKIREAAAAAIRQLANCVQPDPRREKRSTLRSRALRTRSCTLTDAISLFNRMDDGLTQFLIKVQIATK